MDLGLQIQKTNVGIRISILQIPFVQIFRQNRQLRNFRPNLPKYWILGFSVKVDNFESFGPTFGKLPDYVGYFGSNNVEGVADSWVEVQMSWVEVDGAGCTFSNTLLKLCFKAIISCRFIICFRIL